MSSADSMKAILCFDLGGLDSIKIISYRRLGVTLYAFKIPTPNPPLKTKGASHEYANIDATCGFSMFLMVHWEISRSVSRCPCVCCCAWPMLLLRSKVMRHHQSFSHGGCGGWNARGNEAFVSEQWSVYIGLRSKRSAASGLKQGHCKDAC